MITQTEAKELLEAGDWIKTLTDNAEFKKISAGQTWIARIEENGKVYFSIFGQRGTRAIATTREELIKEIDLIF